MADVILKDLEEGDIELVRTWRNSEEISKYMYTSDYITEEDQKQWFVRSQNDKSKKNWIVCYNDKKIGLASLYDIKPQFKSAYWAFYIGDTSVRGAGIGAKIEFQVLSYFFDELKFNKLLCEVFVWNDSVIKLHEKFGFRRESYFREHVFKDGKYYDVVGLALLKNEWQNIKPFMESKLYKRGEN